MSVPSELKQALGELQHIAVKFAMIDGMHEKMTNAECEIVQEVADEIAQLIWGIEWPPGAEQIPHEVTVYYALRKIKARVAYQLLEIFEKCAFHEEKWAGSGFCRLRGDLPDQRMGLRFSIGRQGERQSSKLEFAIIPPAGREREDIQRKLDRHADAFNFAFKQKAKAYNPPTNDPCEVRVSLWEQPIDAIGADPWFSSLIENWISAREGVCRLYCEQSNRLETLLSGLGFKPQAPM
jgi:hypothetical protein